MKKFKRILAGAFATVATLALASFAACNKNTPPPDTSSPEVVEPEIDNTCTNEAKGHEYSEETGVCVYCEKPPLLPKLEDGAQFTNVSPCTHSGNCGCQFKGSGKDGYNGIQLAEGCYTVPLNSKGEVWLSFAVSQAGQYVFCTVDGANGATATRYVASEGGVYKGADAILDEDGNLLSFSNCGKMYYSTFWRTTYQIKGAAGAQVKVRFVRVAEPIWEPSIIRTSVNAQQLTEKAQNQPDNMVLTEAPYTTEYFKNDDGYYYLGTKQNPGKQLYAAISKKADRLFSGKSFTTVLQGAHSALSLYAGETAEGNLNYHSYVPFIMNWTDPDATWYAENNYGYSTEEPAGDPTKVCYQNYCNDDGVYPVNQELFDFLNHYVSAHLPADKNIVDDEGKLTVEQSTLWLSACFTYTEVPLGWQQNPYKLTTGDNDVEVTSSTQWFTVEALDKYILRCNDESITLFDKSFASTQAPFAIKLEQAEDSQGRLIFALKTNDSSTKTVRITVEAIAPPVQETLTVDTHEVSISAGSSAVLSAAGFSASKLYTLTWTAVEGVTVTINNQTCSGTEYVLEEPVESISVELLNGTTEDINFTLTLTEADRPAS